MHSYMYHIGDFNNATLHLTKEERWFYRDLIDIYYDYEKPLPDDFNWICRKVRARTEQEETAVEQVLLEFFNLDENGWHHEKCDEVLANYHANLDKKSKAGKASAEARAKKNKASKGSGNKKATESNSSSTGADNHKPETRNQKVICLAECLEYFNQKAGKQFRNAQQLGKRIDEYSVEEVKQVIDYKVQDWKGTDMEKYLRPETLFNKTKFESYLNDAKSNLPTQTSQGSSEKGLSKSEQVRKSIQEEIARQGSSSDGLADDH